MNFIKSVLIFLPDVLGTDLTGSCKLLQILFSADQHDLPETAVPQILQAGYFFTVADTGMYDGDLIQTVICNDGLFVFVKQAHDLIPPGP
jgi:hypothetical protein